MIKNRYMKFDWEGLDIKSKRQRVIDYIFKQKVNQNNKFKIRKEDYYLKKVSEEEFVKEIDLLAKEGIIKVVCHVKHPTVDLTNWREIELLVSPNEYKKKIQKERRIERREHLRTIREWITLIIAIAGLVLSIFSIYLQYNGGINP